MAQTSTPENLTKDIPEDIIRRKLFDSVMQQEWEKVAEIYEKNRSAHTLTITNSGETALHLAISDPEHKNNKLKNVKKLVEHIKREDRLEVLNLQTEKGNTPLHSAAATGQGGKICKFLIESVEEGKKALELVSVRCKKGETPLFKAVHYGRPGSFSYLHSIMANTGKDFSNFERNDGQSILHDAIIMEHFDLAFYIIQLYKGLVNVVDHQGDSPLHALARKAAAFKSGSSLHGWEKLIYKCISVEKLKPLKSCAKSGEEIPHINETRTGEKRINIDHKESGKGSKIPQEIEQLLKKSHNTSRIWYFFVIFGYGRKTVDKIYKEKLKHTWAEQVLDELLDCASMYDNKQYSVRKPGQQSKNEKKLHNGRLFKIPPRSLLFNEYFGTNGNGDIESSDELDSTEDSEDEYGEYIFEISKEEPSSSSGTNAGN